MILIDTSAWFAAVVASDPNHGTASEFFATLPPARMITSDFVLDETLTLFKRRGVYALGTAVGQGILRGATCRLERITDGDLRAAFQMFSQFSDKGWSFTDCTSLVLMQRIGVSQAMAFDVHFNQFGTIEVLPRRG